MKNRFFKVIIFALAVILLFGTVSSFAFTPYQTYTYSIDGALLDSPMAYQPAQSVASSETGLANSTMCTDMVADADGYIYIVDNENKKIVVLDENYGKINEITEYDDKEGNTLAFENPRGIYVTDPAKAQHADLKDQKYIYVADAAAGASAGRIIVFNEKLEYVRTIFKPDSRVLDDAAFKPAALAVDIYGRIFVVSGGCYEGIIALSHEGDFNGFIGAQAVTYTIWEMIFNQFKTHEDYEEEELKNPDPYNNITVDDEGFIYVTIKFTDADQLGKQLAAITSKDATNSPVRKFNSMGDHILKRNGFFDPGGDVTAFNVEELSTITDVALGAEGAWSILDKNGSAIYTYDQNGQLLYAFGGEGVQLGNCAQIDAMTYHVVDVLDKNGNRVTYDAGGNVVEIDINGNVALYDKNGAIVPTDKNGNIIGYSSEMGTIVDSNGNKVELDGNNPVLASYETKKEYRLLLLDYRAQTGYQINVYTPTSYADAITYALYNENRHNHAETIDAWQVVLTQNNNFDLAYIGIGKAYYYQGDYTRAMEYLAGAYETEYYSLAYAELRKDIIGKWMIPIIAGVIIIAVLLLKFLGWAKKKNKAASVRPGPKKYWEELIFVFHLMFHPFDGFWDVKHEKRGSVRAASTILGLTVLAFFYQSIGQGYIFNPRPTDGNIIVQVLSIVLPVMLWVTANWCLTTLFEGEGSFKDIYVATCYSLAPLPIFITVSTLLSNVLTASEAMIISLLVGIAVVWMVLLVFFGMLVTHDYSMNKNIGTILATVLAAAVIVFVVVLFAGLVTKMYTFVDSIITEITNRM